MLEYLLFCFCTLLSANYPAEIGVPAGKIFIALTKSPSGGSLHLSEVQYIPSPSDNYINVRNIRDLTSLGYGMSATLEYPWTASNNFDFVITIGMVSHDFKIDGIIQINSQGIRLPCNISAKSSLRNVQRDGKRIFALGLTECSPERSCDTIVEVDLCRRSVVPRYQFDPFIRGISAHNTAYDEYRHMYYIVYGYDTPYIKGVDTAGFVKTMTYGPIREASQIEHLLINPNERNALYSFALYNGENRLIRSNLSNNKHTTIVTYNGLYGIWSATLHNNIIYAVMTSHSGLNFQFISTDIRTRRYTSTKLNSTYIPAFLWP